MPSGDEIRQILSERPGDFNLVKKFAHHGAQPRSGGRGERCGIVGDGARAPGRQDQWVGTYGAR